MLTAGNAKAVQGMVREYVLGLSEKWREENDVEAKEGPSALGLQPRKARMKRGVKSAFTGTFDAGWKALIKVHEGILMGNKAGASKVARGLGTGGKHIIKAGFSGYSEFLRGALGMSSLQIEAHDLDAFTAGLQGLKAAGDPLLMGVRLTPRSLSISTAPRDLGLEPFGLLPTRCFSERTTVLQPNPFHLYAVL